jgi:hypothetical protein
MTYNLSGTFPSQSSTLSVNINNIVIYNPANLSFTGPTSSGGNLSGYSFSWTGSGRGVISYGGYSPSSSDPLYPANFLDNVQVNVSGQGSNADFFNSPSSYGRVGISSSSSASTKSPASAQYYGVGGNTGASSNSGGISVQAVFGTTSTAGSTSLTFTVLLDDINYHMAESKSISITIT